MTLLDDARKMNETGGVVYRSVGEYGEYNAEYCPSDCSVDRAGRHHTGCPWISLPRIVAALEAVEAYIRKGPSQHWCPICLRAIRYGGEPHADGCEFAALVAALADESTVTV